MRERLGIDLEDETLPLKDSAGYMSPFWLAPYVAFRTTD
jgi:hypothetical protein